MALKDWRQVRRQSTWLEWHQGLMFSPSFKRVTIGTLDSTSNDWKTKWEVEIFTTKISPAFKYFKTKSQALKFAKSYMRTH